MAPLTKKAQGLLDLLRGDMLSDRERDFLIKYLKDMAAGKLDVVEQLRAKALEFRRSPMPAPNVRLLDYEPCRRIPPMWEFVESPEYLNLGRIVYPRVLDMLVAIDDPTIREAYICAGKGVGKSFICGVLLSRGAFILNSYPFVRQVFHTLPEDYIVVLNMSVSAPQAQKVIFQKLKSIVQKAPAFPRAKIGTREIEFEDAVLALCGHSGYQTFYGYDVFYGCIDEASHFDRTPEHDVAAEIHEGIVASQLTRFPYDYKLVTISSPKDEEDFLTARVMETKEKGTEVRIFTGDSPSDIRQVSYESMGAWRGVDHAHSC